MTYFQRFRLLQPLSRRKFLAGALAAALFPRQILAQADVEYKVKAAFLFNFIKLVEWPLSAFAGAQAPIVIGLVGRDPFDGEFDDAVNGKLVNGRPVEIRRINSAEAVKECHAVFVPASERRKFQDILAEAENIPVLTIGDELENFANRGGIINLFKEADKIRFEINVEAAKKAGLKIHSTLLNLARIIQSNQ